MLENARAAAAEFRAQIDQQLRTADSLDTRATAMLTVGTGAVALIAGRLTVETDLHRVAGIAFGAAALWLLASCLGALSSRSAFAYGADADALVPELEHHSTDVIALTIAKALRDARNKNVAPIGGKHRWYRSAAAALFFLGMTIAGLFSVGAIK